MTAADDEGQSRYAQLAERMGAAARQFIHARPGVSSALRLWHVARLWTVGLARLDASDERLVAAHDAFSAARDKQPLDTQTPAPPEFVAWQNAALLHEYDALALLGLGELLRESVAAVLLEIHGLPLPGRNQRGEQFSCWPHLMTRLKQGRDAPAALVAAALAVDVRLRAGANLHVSHPNPNTMSSAMYDADGHLRWLGANPFVAPEEHAAGRKKLDALNDALPADRRSNEFNNYELARDLIRRAHLMSSSQRRDLALAMRDIGMDIEPYEAAAAAVTLVEVVAGSPGLVEGA